jgi:hypothetical protein
MIPEKAICIVLSVKQKRLKITYNAYNIIFDGIYGKDLKAFMEVI